MNGKFENFIEIVFEMFEFLEDKGFYGKRSLVEATDLYCSVPFLGKDVGVFFSYDLTENYCECYIGRLVDGAVFSNRNLGGYWGTLYAFLVKNRGYRGGIPLPSGTAQHDFKELYGYRALLSEVACIEDRADLFA